MNPNGIFYLDAHISAMNLKAAPHIAKVPSIAIQSVRPSFIRQSYVALHWLIPELRQNCYPR